MLSYLEKFCAISATLSVNINSSFVESVQIIPLTILTNGTFVAALSNKSSTEFQNRALLIKAGVSVTCLLMNFGKHSFTK